MLIDRSYFVVEANIPKTDETAVQENLDALIQKREPELLIDVLGYALYKAFIAGLAVMPIDPKWTNLLLGAEYTDRRGILQKWNGLVSAPPAQLTPVAAANAISYIATQADADAGTIPVPAGLVGRSWAVEKRAIGRLRADEYATNMDGDLVTLADAFLEDETFFFLSNDLSLEQSTGDIKQSLIANYVYFFYLKMTSSVTVALGEVVSLAENSVTNGPAAKQQRAWNEMVEQIHRLTHFLDNNRTVYTEWRWQHLYYVCDQYKAITRW